MAEDQNWPGDDEKPPETPERKPFALVLQEMRKGGLHTELGDELAALVKQCVATGKKGSLVLTLSVDPKDAGNEESMVVVDDKIQVKAPRFDTASTVYWADDKGNLQRNRPSQDRLPMRAVNGGKGQSTNDAADAAQEG